MSEEQEYLDNMPEAFLYSEKGETAQSNIDNLEYAVSNVDDAIDNINEAIER